MRLYRMANPLRPPVAWCRFRRWVELAQPIKLGRGYSAALTRLTLGDGYSELALVVRRPDGSEGFRYFCDDAFTHLPALTGLAAALRAVEEDPATGKPVRGLVEWLAPAGLSTLEEEA